MSALKAKSARNRCSPLPLLQMRYSPGPRRLRIVGFRGLGQLRTRTESPRIVGLDCATRSATGEGASKSDGTIWAWGLDNIDQLGDGGGNAYAPLQVQ